MRHAREMLTAVVVIVVAAGTGWADSNPNDIIKWSQPPIRLSEDASLILGWDQPSMVEEPIAADDWQCLDPRPVTDVHWWGSFPMIDPFSGIAPVQPDGFIIKFWKDVPAGDDPDPNVYWSYPGEEIHRVDVRNYRVEHAGYDVDPWEYMETGNIYIMDEAFQYNAAFDEPNFFHQNLGEIYWISIQAYFDDIEDANVWGWKTRPHYWNDDAVQHWSKLIANGTDASAADLPYWDPIIGPMDESWDLAFELSVPEPVTMALLGIGGVAVLIRRRHA